MPQRTFELIPTTLVKSDGPVRAMTSKEAKKAYQKKNRGPKITRAEQRRLDKLELDRQRKEYERERAASRAKAARDKKAQKAEEEKAERKKNGIPEPSKHVRASQPTISLFVTSGAKRSWQSMAAQPEETISEGTMREDDMPPPAKRLATGDGSEDEFGDFPSLSQTNLPEILDSSLKAFEGLNDLPAQKAISGVDEFDDDDTALEDLATTQLQSEAFDAATKSSSPLIGSPSAMGLAQQEEIVPTVAQEDRITQALQISRQQSQERCVNLNVKPVRAISFGTTPLKPKPFMQNESPPTILSATQEFLETHLDDFFPSPSQQLRELLDNLDDSDLPSNTQTAKELTDYGEFVVDRVLSAAKENGSAEDDEDNFFAGMFSTQDLVLSPQDLLEIASPSRPPTEVLDTKHLPPKPSQGHRLTSEGRPLLPINKEQAQPTLKPRSMFQAPAKLECHEMQLPHDHGQHPTLRDETTAEQAPEVAFETPHPESTSSSKDFRRFFEEKDEDVLLAALHESKNTIVQPRRVEQPQAGPPPLLPLKKTEAPRRTFQRIQSAATDYGDEEFNDQELLALCRY